MARNGSGTYSRAVASYVYNTTIDQVTVNSEMDDIASALTASIAKNGETTPTANLPMGTYRHTGVGNGSARTDYAAMGQAQDGKINWVDGGGTADAITATYSPVITALVDGQECHVRATAANATATPTFSPNALTARTIVKNGGVALVAGDIVGDGHELILRYDLTNTRWELLNPAPDLSSKQPLEATLTSLSGLSLVAGDILYATAADTLQRLAKGTASQQLRMNSGATAPEWATATTSSSDNQFSVYLSANQTVVSSTFTKVALDTEEFDVTGTFDAVTNRRFTPTTAGYFMLAWSVSGATNVTNGAVIGSLYKNGVRYKDGSVPRVDSSASTASTGSALVYMNGTTDYVELFAFVEGVTVSGTIYSTYLTGVRVD